MRYPHVEITDSNTDPLTLKYVYCHDAPAPPRGGFCAGTIKRAKSGWMFHSTSTCGTMLNAEDRANLYIVVNKHITLLNITARLLK